MLPRDRLDPMESIWEALRYSEADSEGELLTLKRDSMGRNQIKGSDSNEYQFYCDRHFLPPWKVPSCPQGLPMSFGFKSFHSYFLSNQCSSEIPDSVTNVCPIQLCPQTVEHTKQAVCEHQKRWSPSFLQHRRMQHRRGVSCHSQDSGHTQDMILYTKSQSWFSLFCSGYI